ncbi:MAG TPA: glycosyltransferase [Bacteroidia bacterium]|jgi:glycosyltransferase involved in cell wall biosynthesis|nr:glycosyltransferase [Bacteroidia bacterium]
MNPVISICIPVYNGEAYLTRCLDSALGQTYVNFEVLIVDDQSTDDTAQIVETYSKRDDRIRLYRNEKNLGLVGNWNKCLELSKGEWIKFIFQDDFMEPDCLETFMSFISEDTQLLVSQRSFVLYENATADEKHYYYNLLRTLENTYCVSGQSQASAQVISKTAVENIALNFIGEPSLTMFRKQALIQTGYFNEDLQQICDLEFFLRMASHTGLTYIPKKLCHFRIHESSATSSNLANKQYILSHLEPIIFVWQLLYNKKFEQFRSFLSPSDFFKLNNFLKVRTYEANIYAKQGHEQLFEETLHKFPELRIYAKETLFTRLKYLLILLRRKIRKLKP